jgi:hypothetical protein
MAGEVLLVHPRLKARISPNRENRWLALIRLAWPKRSALIRARANRDEELVRVGETLRGGKWCALRSLLTFFTISGEAWTDGAPHSMRATARQHATSTRRSGIATLFRRPTGLADGLAQKETRYADESATRPDYLGSPLASRTSSG